MLFNSLSFAIFFIVVTTAYFLLPYRWRWALLLGASCYFYMAFVPIYILILLFTILVDYIAGIQIEQAQGQQRKLFLIFSIIANVGVLALFKYFNFLNANFASLAHFLDWNYPVHNLSILLPIGLSFHTFQSLSYTIEVYRGHQKAERHLGIFALYVMFYPQLVAGPIERPQHILHQFREQHDFDYERVKSGLILMAWGLFKKVVIADRLAVFVNTIYGDPTHYTGFALVLATYFFAYQIYCDFSGYSDIAVGASRVMGFRLMENFHQPYLAQSIAEFWRRWHISLSTWFRDYLYIPLGGNRVSQGRWYLNTLIVFTVSGLWHGASWTFIIWGALHGFYMIMGSLTKGKWALDTSRWGRLAFLGNWVNVLITFHLVAFAWIFFRAATLHDAWYIVTHLFADFHFRLNYGIGFGVAPALIVLFCIAFMEGVQWLHRSGRINFTIQPVWARWSFYYVMIVLIVLFGVMKSNAQFIYFQF
ncbi:MAG: MBOAT family protein [Chloroflexi bacterium]|nr:MBOAT family protein [Chloroflexota bacterium]